MRVRSDRRVKSGLWLASSSGRWLLEDSMDAMIVTDMVKVCAKHSIAARAHSFHLVHPLYLTFSFDFSIPFSTFLLSSFPLLESVPTLYSLHDDSAKHVEGASAGPENNRTKNAFSRNPRPFSPLPATW